ncbi:TPA: hypothetical protein ACH1RC_005471, partial [Klebsiella pneumoniae]
MLNVSFRSTERQTPDTKVLITLNLPDGQKTTIEGEWRHMSDANRLSERITML